MPSKLWDRHGLPHKNNVKQILSAQTIVQCGVIWHFSRRYFHVPSPFLGVPSGDPFRLNPLPLPFAPSPGRNRRLGTLPSHYLQELPLPGNKTADHSPGSLPGQGSAVNLSSTLLS